MCKAGGPRCPKSRGKAAKHAFAQNFKKQAERAGKQVDELKEDNPREYDRQTRERFAFDHPYESDALLRAQSTSTYDEHGAFWNMDEEEDYSQPTFTDEDLISDDPAVVNAYMNYLEDQWRQDFFSQRSGEGYDYDPATAFEEPEEGETIESSNDTTTESERTLEPSGSSHRSNRHLLPEDAVIESPTPSPVFVYGTLRQNQGNYRGILLGHTQKEKTGVELPGGKMVSNGGFPYVLEDDESTVKGDLMYLDYDDLGATMDDLDGLEGTSSLEDERNLYDRTLKFVHVGDNKYVQAWVYVPPVPDQANLAATQAPIESGDWLDR